MKKIFILFCFIALFFAENTQAQFWRTWRRAAPNRIENARTADTTLVRGPLRVGASATSGHVLTADVNGNATFQAATLDGLTDADITGAAAGNTLVRRASGTWVDSVLVAASGISTLTLGASATTFAVTKNVHTIDGDAGGNTVATITGGVAGMILTLKFVDASVTITNDDTGTSNTINISAAFTSSANDILVLMYDGTSWYECSRAVN